MAYLVQPKFASLIYKSIYVLKQANRQLYSKLSDSLFSLGLFPFYYHFTALIIYVDDIVLTGN